MTEPVSLRESTPAELAFYLAGEVPVPLARLAEAYEYSPETVERLLRDRLDTSVSIDSTGFVQLTEKARRPIGKVAKPKLASARDQLEEGRSLRDNGDHKAAADYFESAAATLGMLRSRFEAANYTPKNLNQLHAASKRLHDDSRREVAKDTINYNLIKARGKIRDGERESEGTVVLEEDDYQAATAALRAAIETAQTYNDDRLYADSPALSTDSLEEKLSSIASASGTTADQRESSLSTASGSVDRSEEASTTDTESESTPSSGPKPPSSESTDDAPSQGHPRLSESAFETSWESIPNNERLDGQFLFKVESVAVPKGDKKDYTIKGTDRHGEEISIDIWKTHKLQIDWQASHWYALEHSRGSVWTNKKGQTNKRLSSTSDLTAIELGDDFSPASQTGERTDSKPDINPPKRSKRDQDSVSGETSGPTAQDESSPTESTTTREEETTESSGIFDDIVDEFEEL